MDPEDRQHQLAYHNSAGDIAQDKPPVQDTDNLATLVGKHQLPLVLALHHIHSGQIKHIQQSKDE